MLSAASLLIAQLLLTTSPDPTTPPSYHETRAHVTGYNTVPEQTDSTPCIGASGTNICGRHDAVACPRSIKLGTVVEIRGDTYVCEDRLAKKYDSRFDISCDKDMSCPFEVAGWTTVRVYGPIETRSVSAREANEPSQGVVKITGKESKGHLKQAVATLLSPQTGIERSSAARPRRAVASLVTTTTGTPAPSLPTTLAGASGSILKAPALRKAWMLAERASHLSGG